MVQWIQHLAMLGEGPRHRRIAHGVRIASLPGSRLSRSAQFGSMNAYGTMRDSASGSHLSLRPNIRKLPRQ